MTLPQAFILGVLATVSVQILAGLLRLAWCVRSAVDESKMDESASEDERRGRMGLPDEQVWN